MMPGQSHEQPAPLGGKAYWRKNPFVAASMVPLVMTLIDSRFIGTAPDGAAVFDTGARDVRGRLGSMGTLKLVVGGRKFAIVGRGSYGGTEDGLSDGQRQQLQDFSRRFPAADVRPGRAGWIDRAFNDSAAARMRVWRDALRVAGASLR